MAQQRAKWSQEAEESLLKYIDENLAIFQNAATRGDHGFKDAAAFINKTLDNQTVYTSKHISNKCTSLVAPYRRYGVDLDKFYREGSVCLTSPDCRTNSDIPERLLATQTALKAISPAEDHDLEVFTANKSKHVDMANTVTSAAILPRSGNEQRELLVTSSLPMDLAALQFHQPGPSDGKIRREMDECLDNIRLSIRSYRSDFSIEDRFNGWGEIQQQHPSLFRMIRECFCFNPNLSPLETLVQLDKLYIKRENLLAMMIGYSMFRDVFETEAFPEWFGEPSLAMQLTREAIVNRYGMVEDIIINTSMRKSLMKNAVFRKDGILPRAKEKAEQLNRILYPLFNLKEKADLRFAPKLWGVDSPLIRFQDSLVSIFEKGFLLSCELKLNPLDEHTFFWPEPGVPFTEKSMQAMNKAHLENTMPRVSFGIFPGLSATCSSECAKFRRQRDGSIHGICRSEDSDIISRAVALVDDMTEESHGATLNT